MEKFAKKNGASVRAYKGDAMTLLCFDLDKKKLQNFTGFSIKVTPPGTRRQYYLYNRISYAPDVIAASKLDPKKINIYKMNYAPLQRFSWVHVPGTDEDTKEYLLLIMRKTQSLHLFYFFKHLNLMKLQDIRCGSSRKNGWPHFDCDHVETLPGL